MSSKPLDPLQRSLFPIHTVSQALLVQSRNICGFSCVKSQYIVSLVPNSYVRTSFNLTQQPSSFQEDSEITVCSSLLFVLPKQESEIFLARTYTLKCKPQPVLVGVSSQRAQRLLSVLVLARVWCACNFSWFMLVFRHFIVVQLFAKMYFSWNKVGGLGNNLRNGIDCGICVDFPQSTLYIRIVPSISLSS